MRSSRDPPELGRTLAIAPWPWQGWDSPEGEGVKEGARGFQHTAGRRAEVRTEPCRGGALGVLCSSVHGLVC